MNKFINQCKSVHIHSDPALIDDKSSNSHTLTSK